MYDFIVIGDVTVDHIIPLDSSNAGKSIVVNEGKLTLSYPNKIRLRTAPQIIPGGNAFTVSAAISALGLKVAIYSIIGQDTEGIDLINRLKLRGVDTDLIEVDYDNATNNSFILPLGGDRVIFSYHHPRTYTLPKLNSPKYIYLTSIGEDDQKLFDQVLSQKKNDDFKLVFAPGTLQLEENIREISGVLKQTDIIILNKFEANLLLDDSIEDSLTLLKKVRALGPINVVITDGKNGSVGLFDNSLIQISALQTLVKDSTGAGDTYAATLVAALLMGKTPLEAMQWATINAANIVNQIGIEKGMLNPAQILSTLVDKGNSLVINQTQL